MTNGLTPVPPGPILSCDSPESFLWLFTEGRGTYIFIYCLSNIFFPKEKKKKRQKKTIRKYGNENVRESAGIENAAQQATEQGVLYLFQGSSPDETWTLMSQSRCIISFILSALEMV